MPAGRPGVVCSGKGGSACNRGMAIRPELNEGMWRGVFKRCFAQALKSLAGDSLGIGDDTVDGLLPVDVGCVLDGSAEAVFDRRGEERKHAQYQQHNDKCRPVVLRVDAPPGTITAKRP